MHFLQTKNLTKDFGGVKAVHELTVSIAKGVITALVGPNGAGKTTFLDILSGLCVPDKGEIIFSGTRLSSIKPFNLPLYNITRTFQSVRLFDNMTVMDNILIVLTEREVFSALFERHAKHHSQRAKEILNIVGLRASAEYLAKNLSYGQRKLLEIGRSIAMSTEAILFDEPFAGLSQAMVKQISLLMKDLKAQGKTIVLIEHDIAIVRELADYAIVMDSGKLLAGGVVKEVFERRDVLEAYLGE